MIQPAPVASRLAWVFVVLASAGCASFRATPPPPGAPVPLSADDPLLATLVDGWAHTVEARTALRSGVVLKLSGPQGDRRLNQNVVLARPARLRMEIQAFLTTAAVLVADGSRYDYFQSLNRYREHGPVYPLLLWQIAGVPLTLEQAVHFLLGGPPPRPGLHPAGGERLSDGTVTVELRDAAGRRARSLRFAPEGPLRQVEEWSPDGRLRWRVGYDRYREVGGQPFAHTIEFEFPLYESRATVAFRSVELDPETPASLFELHVSGKEGND